jgi:carboxymethylenebutenolidase
MTTEIARFMVKLERIWEAHLRAVLIDGDPAAALAQTAGRPTLQIIPSMTGASGRDELHRFLAQDVIAHLPDDLERRRVSRTVDRFHLVDEATVSFTHDRMLPWLLPDIEPTGERAEALTITVVGFRRGALETIRVLWDMATLQAQLGLRAAPAGV